MVIKKKINVIIFGASGSIGISIAKKYYRNGHNLYLYLKSKNKIPYIKKLFPKKLDQIIKLKYIDLTNIKKSKKKLNQDKSVFMKADILINTVGEQGEINNFFKLNLDNFVKTFNINFFSYIYLFKNIYPFIKKNKNLLIILFSGGGVTSLRTNFSPYSLSKIALVKLVEILSKEIKNKSIRINSISPGIINSKMTQKTLKVERALIKNDELVNIRKEIKYSDKSLNKVFNLIEFLYSKKGKGISGKMISSRWDNFKDWDKEKVKKMTKNDIYTLRRKIIL